MLVMFPHYSTFRYHTMLKCFFDDFKMVVAFQGNYSAATTDSPKTNQLMYSVTPLTFRWTVPLTKNDFKNFKEGNIIKHEYKKCFLELFS